LQVYFKLHYISTKSTSIVSCIIKESSQKFELAIK